MPSSFTTLVDFQERFSLPLASMRPPIKMYDFAIYKRGRLQVKQEVRDFPNLGQSIHWTELLQKLMRLHRIHGRVHHTRCNRIEPDAFTRKFHRQRSVTDSSPPFVRFKRPAATPAIG